MSARIIIVLTAIFMVSCGGGKKSNSGELEGDITISGAFALYPLAVKWAEEFQKLHPGVHIDISAGGAGKGMTDALSKVADIGMVSREINPSEIQKGAVAFAVAKDAVVPVINSENPVVKELSERGLSQSAAKELWIKGSAKTWGEIIVSASALPIHIYIRSDACGAAETWAQWLGAKQEDLEGTGVFGDPGIASAVQKDKLGVGFNNLSYVYDEASRQPNPGIMVFPIDVNNNGKIDPDEQFYATKDEMIAAIADGRYPSPPARELYMVTSGVPTTPAVKEFLKYILTEGQKHNLEIGYIEIPTEKLQDQLQRLQ